MHTLSRVRFLLQLAVGVALIGARLPQTLWRRLRRNATFATLAKQSVKMTGVSAFWNARKLEPFMYLFGLS